MFSFESPVKAIADLTPTASLGKRGRMCKMCAHVRGTTVILMKNGNWWTNRLAGKPKWRLHRALLAEQKHYYSPLLEALCAVGLIQPDELKVHMAAVELAYEVAQLPSLKDLRAAAAKIGYEVVRQGEVRTVGGQLPT